ncbi:MAG: SAF domain-containing protein [Lapillicoccus sp.]
MSPRLPATWRDRLPGGLASSTRRAAWQRTRLRRALSAVLAGAAVWLLGSPLVPHPPETGVPLLVAARSVAIGATVQSSDVQVILRPPASRPDGALSFVAEAVGRVTAGPVAVGEILTPGRFRGPGQLESLPRGLVAMSVPLIDPGLLPALRPADAVQVIAPGSGQTLARAATVLAVEAPEGGVLGSSADGAGRVILALDADEVRSIAASMSTATGMTGFVLALRPG